MKRLALLLTLVSAVALAGGIALNVGGRYEYTDCAAGGSASQAVRVGPSYLMRVTDADVFVCYSATCATGGEKFPSGTVMMLAFTGRAATQDISCRSAGTGDLILTEADGR